MNRDMCELDHNPDVETFDEERYTEELETAWGLVSEVSRYLRAFLEGEEVPVDENGGPKVEEVAESLREAADLLVLGPGGVPFTSASEAVEYFEERDRALAPVSETALLGEMKRELSGLEAPSEIRAHVEWWETAYDALETLEDAGAPQEAYRRMWEAVFSGDAEGALEIAQEAVR